MDFICAAPGFKSISAVNLFMGLWSGRRKELKLISSSRLSELFDTPKKYAGFYTMLKSYRTDLKSDYRNFLVRVAGKYNDVLSIAIRMEYRMYQIALLRMIRVFEHILANWRTLSSNDVPTAECDEYFAKELLIPGKEIYHSDVGIEVVADIPHLIFMYLSVKGQLKRMIPTTDRPVCDHLMFRETEEELDPLAEEVVVENMPVILDDKELNRIVEYIAHLASYPVIPPDLAGNVLTTHGFDEYEALELKDMSKDNRSRVVGLADDRVCVACKVDSLAIGHTDIIEQDRRMVCNCAVKINRDVYSDEGDDLITTLATTKASMKVRNLVMNGKGGCQCKSHGSVMNAAVNRFTEVLRSLHVF